MTTRIARKGRSQSRVKPAKPAKQPPAASHSVWLLVGDSKFPERYDFDSEELREAFLRGARLVGDFTAYSEFFLPEAVIAWAKTELTD